MHAPLREAFTKGARQEPHRTDKNFGWSCFVADSMQSKLLRGITGVRRILAATAACKVGDWLAYVLVEVGLFRIFAEQCGRMDCRFITSYHPFLVDLPSRNHMVWESGPPDVPIAAPVSIRPRSCPRVTDKGQLTRFALEFGVCRTRDRFSRMEQRLGKSTKT